MKEKDTNHKLNVTVAWNPLQARLKEVILKKDCLEESKQLLHLMHSIVHSSAVYKVREDTYMDKIWSGLDDEVFRTMPSAKDDTIAWNIWHITRIEDLTVNYLIMNQEQVLNEAWQSRLGTDVTDTGNAMTDPEIMKLSSELNREALYEYRNAVAARTKELIDSLGPEDMKRKVSREGLKRIEETGGVTEHEDSKWLLDFWGKKNVAGIFLMPVTRHQIVHLNDCIRLKGICEKLLRRG